MKTAKNSIGPSSHLLNVLTLVINDHSNDIPGAYCREALYWDDHYLIVYVHSLLPPSLKPEINFTICKIFLRRTVIDTKQI